MYFGNFRRCGRREICLLAMRHLPPGLRCFQGAGTRRAPARSAIPLTLCPMPRGSRAHAAARWTCTGTRSKLRGSQSSKTFLKFPLTRTTLKPVLPSGSRRAMKLSLPLNSKKRTTTLWPTRTRKVPAVASAGGGMCTADSENCSSRNITSPANK